MNIKIDTTLERDIDLLIFEEFISDPEFAKIFWMQQESTKNI